jgi:hypothetical protein
MKWFILNFYLLLPAPSHYLLILLHLQFLNYRGAINSKAVYALRLISKLVFLAAKGKGDIRSLLKEILKS